MRAALKIWLPSRVGDGVADDVLEEDLEDTAGLLVDEARDALDATTAGETADGRLGDALDVVAQHLAVALGATLATLATLAAAGHRCLYLQMKANYIRQLRQSENFSGVLSIGETSEKLTWD